MKVLVVGGAGYIGSVVADRLVREGHAVTVLDNLSMGWRESVPAEAAFVQADMGDALALAPVFQAGKFDAVMHFAAFIEAGESVKHPELYFENNSSRTLTLLQTMLKYGVLRLVFSSTAAVYGEPQQVPIVEEHPLISHQRLRGIEADCRTDVGLAAQRSRPALRESALLQRGRGNRHSR